MVPNFVVGGLPPGERLCKVDGVPVVCLFKIMQILAF